jgi:uncharacterized protein YndB with AHSA1/START domain
VANETMTKRGASMSVAVAFAGCVAGCIAHDPLPVASAAGYPEWPSGTEPDACPVYVHNELTVAAPPAVVWEWLLRADLWPSWFDGATAVRFDRGGPSLALGAQVRWHMIGADIRVEVTQLTPMSRLDWQGGASGVEAYHTWLVEPAPGGGTHIVTDETERGPVPWLLRSTIRGKVHDAHQAWLESLGRVAAKGEPPPATRAGT